MFNINIYNKLKETEDLTRQKVN